MDKNDLISRSALKEEVNKKQVVGRFNVLNLIDNAPTVHHSNCDNCEDKALSYSMGFQDGYMTGKAIPQGEWKCPECGEGLFACPNCGADMRQDNEPDKQITIEEYMQSLKGEN